MFIARLLLRNFRAYEGTVDISFPSPAKSRNVYLLGGENGAGKTSLLLALTLGLYGRTSEGLAYSAGRRRHDQAYAWTLEESFNRAASTRGEDSMAVTVGFDAHSDRFEVQREWWFHDGRFVEEDVRLRVNGGPLVDSSHEMGSVDGRGEAVAQLMEAVLPPRVARFFFFDGEEVASLADRDLGKSVVHGLDELLGLDQVQVVVRSLASIEKAERQKLQFEDAASELDQAQRDLEEAESDYASATQQLATARDEQLRVEAFLDKLQADLLELFQGRDVTGAAELRETLAALRVELQEVTRQVSALVNDTLALAPTVDLLRQVAAAADEALREKRRIEVTEGVSAELLELVRKVNSGPIEPKLTPAQRKQLQARAQAEINAIRERNHASPPLLGGFAESELQRVRAKAAALEAGRPLTELREIAGRHQELRLEIRRIEANLRTFEYSGVAGELIAQRPAAETAVARAGEDLRYADTVAAEAEKRLKAAHERINEVEERLAATKSSAAKASIARHARLGLEQFSREMRSRRTTALEAEVSASIRELLHREGALTDVAIDAETGAVSLFDGKHHEIAVPSAGEKELFALSLIKGLGRLSNRDAPMVIDTPLGRLDQAHRVAIVEQFLPSASSQVIVLATDSEIHGDLYAVLRPHLAWQATLTPVVDGGVAVESGRYFHEERLR